MMSTDIAALGAAPPSDTSTASAETPAGAAGAFAALLDEASAAGEADASSQHGTSEDDEENFDELAALSMTSLLNIVASALPVTDAGDADANAGGIEATAITATDIADQAVVTDLTARAVLVDESRNSQLTLSATGDDIEAGTTAAPVMTDAPETTETTLESVLSDAVTSNAPTAAAPAGDTVAAEIETRQGMPNAPAGKAEAEVKATGKSTRSSKSARGQQADETRKPDALNAETTAASLSASAAPVIDAARASTSTQAAEDVRTSGSTAARFARALERAAASASDETMSNGASSANANGSGSGQPSGSDSSTPDRAARFSAAPQRSASNVNVMAFAVDGPVPIDVRALAAGATAAVENGPIEIPERDVVAQLVQSMRLQFRDGIGEAVVKLKPEHLGSVQISLRVENGAIKATVHAEAAAVRQWLESQQDTLRTSLADQGLRLERFVVEPDGERRTAPDDSREQKEQRRRQQHRRRMSENDHPAFEITV